MKHRLGRISCSRAVRHFSERLDGALEKKIREHLSLCPNCLSYLDSLRKVVLLYRRYPEPRLNDRARKHLDAIVHRSH